MFVLRRYIYLHTYYWIHSSILYLIQFLYDLNQIWTFKLNIPVIKKTSKKKKLSVFSSNVVKKILPKTQGFPIEYGLFVLFLDVERIHPH